MGEGFDHPFLVVAAVFSVFASLSPFVQFAGRIMRVLRQDAPGHALNKGSVVFHAGSNVARRWDDFQDYSGADQEYFDRLLPVEGLDFDSADELVVEPAARYPDPPFDVRSQTDVRVEEIPLLPDDPEALAALEVLRDKGYTPEDVRQAFGKLDPVPVTKVRQRQAMRRSLDMRVRTEIGRLLGERGLNPEGRDLDRERRGRSNYVVIKSAIDRQVNASVGRKPRERHEFTKAELIEIDKDFATIVERAVKEAFYARN